MSATAPKRNRDFLGLRMRVANVAFGTLPPPPAALTVTAPLLAVACVAPLICAIPVALAGCAVTLGPSLVAVIAGLALIATAVFVEQTFSIGYVGAAARRSRSTAVGLYVTCYYVGGSLGGVLPGGLWHRWGWPAAWRSWRWCRR